MMICSGGYIQMKQSSTPWAKHQTLMVQAMYVGEDGRP